MKIIYSTWLVNILSLCFADAFTIYPFIFIKKEYKNNYTLLVHEKIHIKQQTELFLFLYFILYILDFCKNYLKYKDIYKAYKNVIFEKEAYIASNTYDYLNKRKPFQFIDYIF